VAEWISGRIDEGRAARMARRGPVSHCRLSRDEYANVAYDLLGVHFDARMPGALNEDPRWHGFDRIGSMLSLSPSHVTRYSGQGGHVNYDAIPNVIYTHPEIASLGKTTTELEAAGIPFRVGKFQLIANGRAKALAATDGFVKIVAHAQTDRILGASIIGARAGDLIAEIAVAVEFSASAEDLGRSIHAHPTMAEAVKEASLDALGRVINS
jgi:hypothetical protein